MDISNTLKKIEKALDLRFEKDTALYISKEDTEKIKESLYESNFQNINAFIKKLGSRVVVKVILKNSWLINFNKQNKKYLKKIFDNIDKEFLKGISKDIVEDNIFSTIEFKNFIEGYYIQSVSLKECKSIYKDKNEKLENRAIAFGRVLEEYIISNNTSDSLRFIDSELKDLSSLYTYLQIKKPNFLVSNLKSIEDKNKMATWIIENKIIDKNDKIWHNLFLSLEDIAFDMSVEYISNYPTWDNKITKHLINKVLKSFSNNDEFEYKIEELYNNNYPIRLLFIHMLEPPKFKNKELANSLIDYFETIELPNNSEKSIERIRNWEVEERGFNSVEEIIHNISTQNVDKNIKTLDYYSIQFNHTNSKIIKQLYEDNYENENIVAVISYYLANILRKNDIPKNFKSIDSDEYINKITEYIEELHINTRFSKDFLDKNGKYTVLAKFNKR